MGSSKNEWKKLMDPFKEWLPAKLACNLLSLTRWSTGHALPITGGPICQQAGSDGQIQGNPISESQLKWVAF